MLARQIKDLLSVCQFSQQKGGGKGMSVIIGLQTLRLSV